MCLEYKWGFLIFKKSAFVVFFIVIYQNIYVVLLIALWKLVRFISKDLKQFQIKSETLKHICQHLAKH
jgi:hypothetical protein